MRSDNGLRISRKLGILLNRIIFMWNDVWTLRKFWVRTAVLWTRMTDWWLARRILDLWSRGWRHWSTSSGINLWFFLLFLRTVICVLKCRVFCGKYDWRETRRWLKMTFWNTFSIFQMFCCNFMWFKMCGIGIQFTNWGRCWRSKSFFLMEVGISLSKNIHTCFHILKFELFNFKISFQISVNIKINTVILNKPPRSALRLLEKLVRKIRGTFAGKITDNFTEKLRR